MSALNSQWIFVQRPEGAASRDCFEVREAPIPQPGPGEVLVRNVYLIVPASMRLWMNAEPTYFPPQPLGEVMMGGTLGVVEASNAEGFSKGQLVNTFGGWQTYCVMPAEQLMPVQKHPEIELGAYCSVLHVQGLTAYAGVTDICDVQRDETMVVTAAAGSVGSLACQIARERGAKVIGVAGGPEKCAWLRETCGVPATIDYRNDDVAERLDHLASSGIDCIFENVGGPVFDAMLPRMNKNARIALCGLVSIYQDGAAQAYDNLMQIVYKTARLQGFLVSDYFHRLPEVIPELERMVLHGKLAYRLDYWQGLESAVDAMNALATGKNTGMGVVQISELP